MAGRKPVVQCTQSEWREMIRQLKACCPPPENYDWRFIWCKTVDQDGSLGDFHVQAPAEGKRGVVYIRVLKGMAHVSTLDTLMHEMAHAYDNILGAHHSWAGHHSDTFWIWMGRIYRRWHGE